MPQDLSGLRKSAIVLLSLGEQQAELVLRQLDDQANARVRREMQAALAANPADRAAALRAFIEISADDDADAAEDLPSSGAPFAAFHDTETHTLLDSIRDEHPQTIALVLAHLQPSKAGEILAGLAPSKQVDVVKR